ncbi:(2E,6E)-farnesyl diphosphate synthase [Paraneptunicella aestuarii]|uniref:(2E,6E)-farnesyl diphosphate synthase n=1 Tax=Paraneptunicella aestuarii TaxID=2831148 RepID=UPI001E2E56B2|nr:farnesyl diphosphate synthase [Paraneptunicella aestuarii]UAA40803.1 (2E,6E)-farnesyl diphosphate synthase [Paraneptunicella aestuarii]
MPWKAFQEQVAVRMESLLTEQINALPEHHSNLKAAMQHSLLAGGKRMRPFLVYAAGEILHVDKANLDMCALAVECIHTYSLIHDDLPAMDDDDLRRGKPTCHVVYGEASAILAGDSLQTLAFDILANYPAPATLERVKLVSILSRAAGYQGMCGGQALDLAATNKTVSLSALHQIHELKTGALIKSCIEMVCALAHLNEQETDSFSQYAHALGLAFQVRDDILDVTSDTQTLGKPQGSDQDANKSTFPSLMGLEQAQQYLQDLHQQALHALDAIPYNTELLNAFSHYVVQREH